MNPALICLHEDALRITHPIFKFAPTGTKAIYVWDDEYLRRANYSLKRLVFLYETLCDLPVDVVRGATRTVVMAMTPAMLYVPATNNPSLLSLFAGISPATPSHFCRRRHFCSHGKNIGSAPLFSILEQGGKKCFPSQRRRTCLTIMYADRKV